MDTPERGDVVSVWVWDHAEDSGKVLPFVVFGVVSKINRREIVVNSWANKKNPSRRDHNVKTFAISRGSVTGLEVLKRKR